MPLTREQINDIKVVVKDCMEELFRDDSFIERIGDIVTKSIEKKIDDVLKTHTACIERLKEENNILRDKMDSLEQYTRRNNIRIFGLIEEPNENLETKVLALCRDELGVDIELKDIDRVHRLGKIDKSKSSRPIIIKFTNYGSKQNVMRSKSKLKTCAAKLFISEDLTKTKYELYRATQKRCGNRNVWCIDGEIKVKMRNKVFAIKSLHDLSTV